jgi:hypothetical protein
LKSIFVGLIAREVIRAQTRSHFLPTVVWGYPDEYSHS